MNYIYKIRHKPTGLFYRPKCTYTLDEKGKSYTTKPSFHYLTIKYMNISPKNVAQLCLANGKIEVVNEDFEICKFIIVLDETFQYIKK